MYLDLIDIANNERTVMPKGARLPGLVITEDDRNEQIKVIHEKNEFDHVIKNDKRAELERLVQCKKKMEDNLAKLRIKIDEKEKTSEKIIENLQKKKEEKE